MMQNMTNESIKPLGRVPEVTLYFWIIKILATTVGETAADHLSDTLNLGLYNTSYIMTGLLLLVLLNQFRLKRYVPTNYWLVVVLVSIVGTLITDLLIDDFGVTKLAATIGFSSILIAIFAAWYGSEKTLAMHSICTAKRELFYWAVILCTFALGTAAGDFLAEASGLGYLSSALVFGSAIGATATGYYYFRIPEILAFWFAYILTRPFGASIGDWLSQSNDNGGMGFGTVGTSVIFLSIISILITYLTLTGKDRPRLRNRQLEDF